MDIDEVCALLDKGNPYSEPLRGTLETLRHVRVSFERRDTDLVDVVHNLGTRRLYPVVDKKLRLVFGVDGGHGFLRGELFRYHYHADDPRLEKRHIGPDESADRYLYEGHGYFISAMRPSIIVVSANYRPDQFDKDLFLSYELYRVDE